MGILKNSRHEQFAQLVVRGARASRAYVSLWGEAKGADQSASRLLRSAQISARIAELRLKVAEELLTGTILDRKSRLKALENRWGELNAVRQARIEEHKALVALVSLAQPDLEEPFPKEAFDEWRGRYRVLAVLVQNSKSGLVRIATFIAPGGETGWILRDFRGKNAEQIIFKEDLGLSSELRAIEEQIAREKGEWMERRELTVRRTGVTEMSDEELARIARGGAAQDKSALVQ